ncbi:hypothetical protein SUGI_0715760 [Cryptomeria japonica]|nr:hypothetical protein SUGI_0715760 [Cryptomeria japonica]
MELYGFENWGQYVIHEAHLSQRFKCDNNGYYHCCLSIPFPEVDIRVDDTYEITKEIVEIIAQEMSEACGMGNDADIREGKKFEESRSNKIKPLLRREGTNIDSTSKDISKTKDNHGRWGKFVEDLPQVHEARNKNLHNGEAMDIDKVEANVEEEVDPIDAFINILVVIDAENLSNKTDNSVRIRKEVKDLNYGKKQKEIK